MKTSLFVLVLYVAFALKTEVVEHFAQNELEVVVPTLQLETFCGIFGFDGHESMVGNINGGAVAMARISGSIAVASLEPFDVACGTEDGRDNWQMGLEAFGR